jgi:uncharacterized damage-inducible protein DinB
MILVKELEKAWHGDPWHGTNAHELIHAANPAKVFDKPVPGAHSIAEMVLHMCAWTEEAARRLEGRAAQEPDRGDWPDPTVYSWEELIKMFDDANKKLVALVNELKEDDLNQPVKDERVPALGTGVSNAELISGIVQHHAYHSGQIALLLKFG